jgi:O-antigen/teichoic acid export membrane protein
MTLLKRNIVANFCGNAWTGLISLVFVPMYIHFLGIEAYGLVGVFAMMQSILGLLDMGLSATITREMARLSVLPGRSEETRNLIRSLEVICWGVAVLIGIIVVSASPYITHYWLKTGQLPSETVDHALCAMGFAMALQWPSAFYAGGLVGLQRQITLNVVTAGMGSLRGAGAVLVLWLINPTIDAFFKWQILISAATTFMLAVYMWRCLPRVDKRPMFQLRLLKGVWRFAAGMSGISILAAILTQVDKVILSRMLTLEMFGYYTLAGVVAMSLYRLSGPVFSAIYPRFTQLVSMAENDKLKLLYHQSSQLMSVLVLPVSVVIALFSYEILLAWTQDPAAAEKAHILVSVLICGTALNISVHVPYALQLANGMTRLSIKVNAVAIITLVPLIIFMTNQFGAIGGATGWLILNIGYIIFVVPMVHRSLLPFENWRWYWQDVGVPLTACLAVGGLGRILLHSSPSQSIAVWYPALVGLLSLSVTAVATPATRVWLSEKIRCRHEH